MSFFVRDGGQLLPICPLSAQRFSRIRIRKLASPMSIIQERLAEERRECKASFVGHSLQYRSLRVRQPNRNQICSFFSHHLVVTAQDVGCDFCGTNVYFRYSKTDRGVSVNYWARTAQSRSSLITLPCKHRLTPKATLLIDITSNQPEPSCKRSDLTQKDIRLIRQHSRCLKKFAVNKLQGNTQDATRLQIISIITRNDDKIAVAARKARVEVIAGHLGVHANAYSVLLAWLYGRQLALAETAQEYGT
jgi:hypothetical protein